DHINPLAIFLIHCGVFILDVPVVDQPHHRSQAVKFRRAQERILLPPPGLDLLSGLPLQARALHDAFRADPLPSAMKGRRHALHPDLRQIIILIGEITYGPHDPGRRRLRPRFAAQFHLPLDTIAIEHTVLRITAAQVLFHESVGSVRRMLAPAGAVKQVAGTNVVRGTPEDLSVLARNRGGREQCQGDRGNPYIYAHRTSTNGSSTATWDARALPRCRTDHETADSTG